MNAVATRSASSTSRAVRPLNYAAARAPELHSVKAIAAATFVGSALAGAIVMAINFRRLGRRDMVVPTILVGAIVTAVIIGIGLALPAGTPGMIFVIGQIALARLAANKTQGEALAAHEQRGGKIASPWKAVGIGAICFVALLSIIVAIVWQTL